MTTETQSPREVLKDKVVALVKNFMKTEGGITQFDLQILFGIPGTAIWSEIATALSGEKITLV